MYLIKTTQNFELENEIFMDIEFSFKEFSIKNIGNKTIEITRFLEVESPLSLNDISLYNRSSYLPILGICSFILDHPLSFFDVKSLSQERLEDKEVINFNGINKIIVNDIDYSTDLEKLIKLLTNGDKSILTVLDRFRKALFMENESAQRGSDLYNDEAILIYFNIIEFLTEKYEKQFGSYLESNIKDVIENFYDKAFYLTNEEKTNKQNENFKLIKAILFEKEKTIKNKILFMLNELGVHSYQLNLLISDFVKNRNNIAHGNVTTKVDLVYGQSFFNLELNSSNVSNNLKEICKVIISKHFQLDKTFEDNYLENMPITKKILKDIIKNPTNYKLKKVNLINIENNINYYTLYISYLTNGEINFNKFCSVIESEYLNVECTKTTAEIILGISTVLTDSKNLITSNKAKENIIKIISNEWFNKSDLKFIYEQQNFYDTKFHWFESYIETL